MAIQADLTEVDPMTAGTFQQVAAGMAHLLVVDAIEYGGKQQEHTVKFEVLAHTDPRQVGKTHTEYYPTAANMAWKLLGFCFAVKIANREEMARAKASGQQVAPIELKDAIGRQLFATFKASQNKEGTKDFINIDRPLTVNDPEAEKHPRNAEMLARALGTVQSASVMPPVQVAQQTQQTAPKVDPFARLAAK